MKSTCLKPVLVMYNFLVDAMCKFRNLRDARELFSELFVKGLQCGVQIYSTIINGLRKKGLLDEALEAFWNMEEDGCPPDKFSYNVIIQGFLQHKDEWQCNLLVKWETEVSLRMWDHNLVEDLLSNEDNLVLKKYLGLREVCQGEKVMQTFISRCCKFMWQISSNFSSTWKLFLVQSCQHLNNGASYMPPNHWNC